MYMYIYIFEYTYLQSYEWFFSLLFCSTNLQVSRHPKPNSPKCHQTQSNSSQNQLKAKLKINTREANLIQIPTINNPVFFSKFEIRRFFLHHPFNLPAFLVEVVFPQQGSIFIPAHLRVLHVTQEAIILEKSPWRNLHLGFGLSLEM